MQAAAGVAEPVTWRWRSLVGAVLAVLSYSSLAMVLLTATLASTERGPGRCGAGPGAGRQPGQRPAGGADHAQRPTSQTRQVPLGNLLFKVLGVAIVAPLVGAVAAIFRPPAGARPGHPGRVVPPGFNLLVGLVFIGLTQVGGALGRQGCCRAGRTAVDGPSAPGSVGAGHALAGHLLRSARGHAPGRRGGDHAARHAGGDQDQRPAAGRRRCARWTTRWTSCTRTSSTT